MYEAVVSDRPRPPSRLRETLGHTRAAALEAVRGRDRRERASCRTVRLGKRVGTTETSEFASTPASCGGLRRAARRDR